MFSFKYSLSLSCHLKAASFFLFTYQTKSKTTTHFKSKKNILFISELLKKKLLKCLANLLYLVFI